MIQILKDARLQKLVKKKIIKNTELKLFLVLQATLNLRQSIKATDM